MFYPQVEPNPKRLSAVERLEADKAKYVKSQEVINAKQEPIKPPVLAKPTAALLSRRERAGPGAGLQQQHQTRAQRSTKRENLNLEILKNLLNSGPGAEGFGGGAKSAVLRTSGGLTRSWTPSGVPLTYRSTMTLNEQPSDCAPSPGTSHSLRSFSHSLKVLPITSSGRCSPQLGANLNLSRRRADSTLPERSCSPLPPSSPPTPPPTAQTLQRETSAFLRRSSSSSAPPIPPKPTPLPPASRFILIVTSTTAPVAFPYDNTNPQSLPCDVPDSSNNPDPNNAESSSVTRSDLSDRYARAGADVERFFNYCGLDPEELESVGPENFARANSDIVSLNFKSASMISSDCDQSRRSSNDGLSDADDEEEEEAGERVPYGISAVERNARVIKWLYSIKQAKETQKVSHV
ncbi:hypothetical protein WMY93_001015 [Mugilogobius chulae]|uniref:Protein FAM110B n=1 Tax=Mugilogobius chulae TaxID=88201 RepID=A0AAW0Q453_9GOBI